MAKPKKTTKPTTEVISIKDYIGVNTAYYKAYKAFDTITGQISVDEAVEIAPYAAICAYAKKGTCSIDCYAGQTPLPEPQPTDYANEGVYREALDAYEKSLKLVHLYVFSRKYNREESGELTVVVQHPDGTRRIDCDCTAEFKIIARLLRLDKSLSQRYFNEDNVETRSNALEDYYALTDGGKKSLQLFWPEAMQNLAKLLAQDAEK